MTENNPYNYLSLTTLKDHLFWIFLFLFTDPGGMIAGNSGSKSYVNIGIFLFMTFLFFFTHGLKGVSENSRYKGNFQLQFFYGQCIMPSSLAFLTTRQLILFLF